MEHKCPGPDINQLFRERKGGLGSQSHTIHQRECTERWGNKILRLQPAGKLWFSAERQTSPPLLSVYNTDLLTQQCWRNSLNDQGNSHPARSSVPTGPLGVDMTGKSWQDPVEDYSRLPQTSTCRFVMFVQGKQDNLHSHMQIIGIVSTPVVEWGPCVACPSEIPQKASECP